MKKELILKKGDFAISQVTRKAGEYNERDYLTKGKKYEILDVGDGNFYIKSDSDKDLFCLSDMGCSHQRGGYWKFEKATL